MLLLFSVLFTAVVIAESELSKWAEAKVNVARCHHGSQIERVYHSQSCSQDQKFQDQDQDRQVSIHNKMQITYKLLNICCQLLKTNQMTKSEHENCSAHRRCSAVRLQMCITLWEN